MRDLTRHKSPLWARVVMLYAHENDKLPVRDLGRKLRDLNVKLVAEPMPEEMVVILEKLKRQLEAASNKR